jgi:4-hydroxybenzoate polyprenyltransferase
MGAFLRLTRPLNLLIIIFTMVAIRHGVVDAYLDASSADLRSVAVTPDATLIAKVPGNTFTHAFSELHFWLLVLSTVLIAAGGNVINDYFDTRIDRVNKPDHVIVGRSVKRRAAMMGHLVLTALGIVIGAFVAWRSGQLHFVVLPLFAAGALWWYSTKLKRSFLLGNGLVALLVAIVPLSVGLYEVPALARAYGDVATVQVADGKTMEAAFGFEGLWAWILGYTFFAFLTTLVRELQKDMADMKGDEADGCRTVPIVWGVKWAKVLALFYLTCAILALLLVRAVALTDTLSHWYIGLGIIAPLLLSAGFTYNAATRLEFNTAGNILKAGMAIAIAFAFLVRHTL